MHGHAVLADHSGRMYGVGRAVVMRPVSEYDHRLALAAGRLGEALLQSHAVRAVAGVLRRLLTCVGRPPKDASGEVASHHVVDLAQLLQQLGVPAQDAVHGRLAGQPGRRVRDAGHRVAAVHQQQERPPGHLVMHRLQAGAQQAEHQHAHRA